ncbi:MAG: type V CRISPR-associated protein Cas12b [Parvibaculum sp.]|nr:type V CRISPR-associated protein Cas12b [Parvibaculum sp.]
MATKSYKLRLDLRAGQPVADRDRFDERTKERESVQRWLDDTREAFNTGVDYLTGWLLRMHRGAGVCREKRDGIWREWQEITALDALNEARSRHKNDPGSFALLENRELLDAFRGKGKSESESVELAEYCRRLILHKTLLGAKRENAPMSRGALDDLTPSRSSKRGKRPEGKRGRWARWQLDKAILEEAAHSHSTADLLKRLGERMEFADGKRDAAKRLQEIKSKANGQSWSLVKQWLDETCGSWPEKQKESEANRADWDQLLQPLRDAGLLPLPEFARPTAHVGITGKVSVWNYAMWNMAGQRVRSHLGWVRRRATERLLWELRTTLFERGGWIRLKRDGKPIRKDGLTPDDIRFENPPDGEAGDFEQRHAFAGRKWVETLREYETHEMPKHLEAIAFGAAEQPRVRRRTAKGWAKVRDKWIDLIAKVSKADKPAPSADDLLEAFDQMRTRKTRDFGDRRLFEWLASPERRWLWDGTDKGEDNECGREDRDCLTAFIAHNEHLADQPKSITWTQVDPVKHPVWPFFGENSAVEYWLTREKTPSGDARLVLVLKQLLARQADGSYSAVDRVKIALRGYDDFEKSFALPDDAGDVSAKQTLVFRDDLLSGQTRQGTLSGMKLTWERDELEASHQKRQPTKKPPRIYANFSCDAGEADLPEWLTKHVGSDVKLKKPRDGMTRAFFLKKTISKDGATEDGGIRLPPGERQWPKEAIDHGFTVRGTDLGYRTSSAGALWRLSFAKPDGKTAWQVGKCEGKPVYAVLERTATVSLPGDGETLPAEEQALRERLYSLRTRLNLNNSLLRIARLLTLDAITQRKPDGAKVRKRADGITKRIGTKWKTETRSLDETEIKENCRKAAEQLVRWASTDAMTESLKAIGHERALWAWLAGRDPSLQPLGEKAPATEVPTEKESGKQGINREAAKAKRQAEDEAFAEAVHQLRMPLAKSLCDGYDAEKRRRATSGLWYEFDAALMREVSYGDRGDNGGKRDLFEYGLFRLLRKPPATKHGDRKDDTNNLPHGRTHRGGVSITRLNFLDDVKNLVRRWSCRPRLPGDVRRVPRDAKVNRGDTSHLDNLREHRAKLIAHADVAQALGFEQDLRRGVWRYRDKSGQLLWHRPERGHWYREQDGCLVQCQPSSTVGDDHARHPHPAYTPAHVLVYEDLTRYRMSSDRPKNENAGLARWSHRRILAFAQHIGGLFGVPVATVDARFSSRYCSHCGAPGCRAVRFDPAWLSQSWLQRIRKDTKDRSTASANMRKVAADVEQQLKNNPHALDREEDRPWVLRDGGTHFVCASTSCPVHSTPIDADENAAGNVGLRFLRGIDGIRATISGNGTVTRSIGYVDRGTVLVQVGDGEASEREPYWSNGDGGRSRTRTAERRKGVAGSPVPGDDIEDDDESGGVRVLFRDPSGGFRDNDRWFEGKVFWGAVARVCAAGINATNASRFGSADDD